MTRRDALRGAGTLGLGFALGGCGSSRSPVPGLPEGTDTLPQIEHVVILMMENHSFDSYFGMLDPAVGFPLRNGQPAVYCPNGHGSVISAFHMPSPCQLQSEPSQSWDASHISYADGRNDGFVRASGAVAMGYWTAADIPFYHGLAQTFPLASRWFSSTLCQTYPNRRFLMAGTAAGIIDTSFESLQAPPPPNGNIFERLDAFGISWANYYADVSSVLILPDYAFQNIDKLLLIQQFFTDAAAGTLPSVSLVDPAFNTGGSEENPDDIQIGEQFAHQVISAVMSGPGWPRTLLVWLYDEHGGYYDHVPPPAAVPPDSIPPDLGPRNQPGGYDRYGFRVPAVIVSPYARPNYVSTVVRDHTAILRFIERKWNLAPLTNRDAAADDLSDCLDFVNPPAFLDPPTLPAPALGAGQQPTCTPGDAGTIPPPPAVSRGPRVVSGVGGSRVRRSGRIETRMGEPLARIWAARAGSRSAPSRSR